ncbi:MAG: hypothetical protein HYV20_16010, partial [Gemmatimonadetes bacterium]|nr:hypothetical protein [Gemmatimonadota bacterium]
MAELRILGPPQLVASDGQTVEALARQAKRMALLAYLAAAMPRGFQRRDKLVALFWPELDEPHARNALSQALYVLRAALGEQAILTRGDGEVSLNGDVVWCDVPAFEGALDAGRPAEAAALYRGDLLDGLFVTGAPEFERWLDGERTRLRQRASEGAWALAEAKAAEGDALEAGRWARRAADLVPADEAVVRRLMAFLHRLGDRAAAIRAYEAFAWRLAHEYELEPSAETRALAAAIREEEQDRPALRSTPPAPAGRAARRRRRVGQFGALVIGGLVALGAIGVWLRWPSREAGARGELPRIAVLPVTNLAGDAEQDRIADGMTDLLINYLSRISGFDRVISRTSVMPYKQTRKSLRQIGRELGVDVLVEASVLHDGEQVRINVSLIDAATEQRRWSNSFERPLRNVLALQRDVARVIAREVAVALTPEEVVRLRQAAPSIDPMAFSLYLQATRSPWRNLSELQQKVAHLEQAVALDSGFAAAYVALAIHSAVDLTDYARAEEVVQRALALDPYLPSAHVAHALVRQWAHSDWAGAAAALRRALELAPLDAGSHHELAMLLMRLGRFDEALAAEERALYLDPPSSHY